MPQVSVVIPVWGEAATRAVRQAVESIQAQDEAAEILLVDNASDPPVEAPPGATVVRTPRRLTLGATRNFGLDQVRTPLVMLFDADDVLLPGALGRLVERMDAHPELVACCPTIVDGLTGQHHHWPRPRPFALGPRAFAVLNAVSSLFPTAGAVMRTDAARQARFDDTDRGDDWVLGVSLAFRGAVALDPDEGRLYTRREDSVSTGWTRADAEKHASQVRTRLRTDPAVPPAVRRSIPLIRLAQTVVLRVIRPLARRTPLRRRERS